MMFSASSAPHMGRTPDSSRASLYTGLLALLVTLLILPVPSAAQTTQTLSLEQGWNFASLHVQPPDSSFASIFGGTNGSISSVKNEDGEAYLPSLGIEQISTWRTDEGYKVYAETATTLDVTGTALAPAKVAITLEEGGNIVPYLPDRALAVEEALVSIDGSLVAVEDEDGRQYPSGSTPLDSLRPGRGYKVYVERADTLRYPVVAKTLDDALALTGIPVGSQVRVQGYHEPGDGGGGLFRVTDSGAETDGGTVFVFDEDASTQTSVDKNANWYSDEPLPDSDLIWGTVEVQLGQSSGQPVAGDKRFLHGHSQRNSSQNYPMVDYKEGAFGDTHGRINAAVDWASGSGTMVRYKHASSDRRLERVGVKNAVNIAWWGAKKADPSNPVNSWWAVNWALNKAHEIYEDGDYEWAYVDIPGEYYYRYMIRIREGVKLRGASDQTFGQAANGQPTYGKLTMMPGMAVHHLEDGWDELEGVFKFEEIDLTHETNASKIGLESLEADGNISNNLDPIQNSDNYGDVQGKLQGGNHWNGLASKGKNSFQTPDGATAELTDVYVHDFPGNGLGMGRAFDFTPSSNVRIKDAPRNHQTYRVEGTLDDWTVEGAGWASILKEIGATYKNLTLDLSTNKLTQYWGVTWNRVFGHHGKGFGINWNDVSLSEYKQKVLGFSVDLPDDPNTYPVIFPDRGYGGTYRDGTINTSQTKNVTLLKPVNTGGNGPIRDYTYKNITVNDEGGGVKLISGRQGPYHNLILENFIINGNSNTNPFLGLTSDPLPVFAEKDAGSNIPIGKAPRSDLKSITVTGSITGSPLVRVTNMAGTDTAPYDLFIQDSTLPYSGSPFVGTENNGSLSALRASTRVYMDNVEFEVPTPRAGFRSGGGFHRNIINSDGHPLRLRNCTSVGGFVSETSGSYTSDASDEGNDYVLVPTRLMSRPQERIASVTGGNRSVTSIEIANQDGTLRDWNPDADDPVNQREPYLKINLDSAIQSGNAITVDYVARITPLDEYQTTGLFVARPVSDQGYTSGNGPFTVDLRGGAASQESKEPISYNASSDDASVVTASVNSYTNHKGNRVPWELELMEQGTGTATITVTGSINGIGSTTHTFEVTVE